MCSATALANEGNIEDAVPLYLHVRVRVVSMVTCVLTSNVGTEDF